VLCLVWLQRPGARTLLLLKHKISVANSLKRRARHVRGEYLCPRGGGGSLWFSARLR
jgi:hypothetical protein